MLRRDNQRQIGIVSVNILQKLQKKFVPRDEVDAEEIHSDEIISNNLETQMCCEIILGLDMLEAPFETTKRDEDLIIQCELEGDELDEKFTRMASWVDKKEPDILAAADDHDIEHLDDVIEAYTNS